MKKLVLFTLFCVLGSLSLHADVSPKPEMKFSFIYNTESKPLIDSVHSEQIQCSDSQCIESKPLGKYGAQQLYCSSGTCFSIAYEYDNFQKLVIAFTDGTKRESNIFPTPSTLRSRFNVYVEKDYLTVEESTLPTPPSDWSRADAWTSLTIILVLELLAATAYLIYNQKPFTILYSVLVANLCTTLLSWSLLSRFVSETAFLWLFCLLTETLILRWWNFKKLSLSDSFVLSLAMNVTSYSLGMMISFCIAPWLF